MFTQRGAVAIAQKLGAEIVRGRGHDLAIFLCGRRWIGQFGIRRASKEVGHDYISMQLHLAQGECKKFRTCEMTFAQLVGLLMREGIIPQQ